MISGFFERLARRLGSTELRIVGLALERAGKIEKYISVKPAEMAKTIGSTENETRRAIVWLSAAKVFQQNPDDKREYRVSLAGLEALPDAKKTKVTWPAALLKDDPQLKLIPIEVKIPAALRAELGIATEKIAFMHGCYEDAALYQKYLETKREQATKRNKEKFDRQGAAFKAFMSVWGRWAKTNPEISGIDAQRLEREKRAQEQAAAAKAER